MSMIYFLLTLFLILFAVVLILLFIHNEELLELERRQAAWVNCWKKEIVRRINKLHYALREGYHSFRWHLEPVVIVEDVMDPELELELVNIMRTHEEKEGGS